MTFADFIDDSFAEEYASKSIIEDAVATVELAATTKLEYKTLLSIFANDKDGAGFLKSAERNYSIKYRLTRTEHVHPSLTKKRDEFIANH